MPKLPERVAVEAEKLSLKISHKKTKTMVTSKLIEKVKLFLPKSEEELECIEHIK